MSSYTTLGRYEIVRQLGKGAMGVVYLAKDPLIGRLVALKTFRVGFDPADDDLAEFRARFIREAQSAGILSHPNIVTIHDVVEDAEHHMTFIAMEFVDGVDLKRVVGSDREIGLEHVARVADQVGDAIDYAHEKGVIHRDIKPANIIIDDDWTVKITDFGIARMETSDLTQEGQLLGTPNYMAPERILGRDIDRRTDVYSLGVVLYELLTRNKPFRGDNLTMVTHRIVYEPFTPLDTYTPGLPPGATEVLARAMAKEPADRFSTGLELARAFRSVLGEARSMESAAQIAVADGATGGSETQDVSKLVGRPLPPPPVVGEETLAVDASALEPPRPSQREAPPPRSPTATPPPPPPPIAAAAAAQTGANPAGGEPDDDRDEGSTGFGKLPPVVDLDALKGERTTRSLPWRGLAAAAGVGLMLVVGGWFALRPGTTEAPSAEISEVPAVSPVETADPRSEAWLRVARTAYEDGRPVVAARFLEEAIALAPGDEELQSFGSELSDAVVVWREERAAEARLAALETGRSAIAAGRWAEAEEALAALIATDSEDEEATALLAQVERGRSQADRRRRERDEADRRRAEIAAEAERLAAEEAARPAVPEPLTFPLEVDFYTELSEGVFVLYVDADQRLNERFNFVKRINAFRSERKPGRIQASLDLPKGQHTLRAIVSIDGEPAKVASVDETFVGGVVRKLAIRLDGSGQLSLSLE